MHSEHTRLLWCLIKASPLLRKKNLMPYDIKDSVPKISNSKNMSLINKLKIYLYKSSKTNTDQQFIVTVIS